MPSNVKTISIVIPVFNEENNIPLLYEELCRVWKKLEDKFNYEMIFINDGSRDGSAKAISKLTQADRNIRSLEFSRNFGKESATSAGLHHARGVAVIVLDADLQHPPKIIPEFIKHWQEGAEIVIGVRKKNNGEGFVKKAGSKIFYWLMKRIGETPLVSGATDFRLIDEKVIKEFNRFTERNRITRGLLDWLGFKTTHVYFEAPARTSGKAGYSLRKLFRLAASSFTTHSLFPLKLAGYTGFFIVSASTLVGLFVVMEKYIFGDPWGLYFSNLGLLILVILFLVGLILICLGLIALYIGNIYQEVGNRPIYVIKDKLNFND
ncbi:MAG TPA: glycosyltransferase family 2 protein [Candidatus Paceibacterota bacterium]|nr:glycosyltransferase family 2 protein [Candidatus Paceibacterota bacterium]